MDGRKRVKLPLCVSELGNFLESIDDVSLSRGTSKMLFIFLCSVSGVPHPPSLFFVTFFKGGIRGELFPEKEGKKNEMRGLVKWVSQASWKM